MCRGRWCARWRECRVLRVVRVFRVRGCFGFGGQGTGVAPVRGLACAPGLVDPVMCSLGAAVLALFERPQPAATGVQQHLALAICAHLVHRFGNNADSAAAMPHAMQLH
jgi:hypothetical protein